MKVILKKDIKGLGSAGDVKAVADGYARNFLLPRELVLEAGAGNLRRWEHEKKAIEKKRNAEISAAQDFAAELEKSSCTINVKTGEDDRMFGSVHAAHIAEGLKVAGFTVDKKNITLSEPIKEPGAYVVDIRVHSQVHAKVKVWVIGQK